MLVVTCPDVRTAESIARRLVEERLVACGNVTTPVTSIYRWKGKVQRDSEAILLLKTRRSLIRDSTRRVRSLHPYELPEIIAIPNYRGPAGLSGVGRAGDEAADEGPPMTADACACDAL